MKRFLLPHLICPSCLPKEHPLELTQHDCDGEEILTATLHCKKCKRRFPIRDGIALLVPDPDSAPAGGWRYEEGGMRESYLWSHFGDLLGDPEAGSANAEWADCLTCCQGGALDAGCSVGRIAFEMARRSDWAVGCDLSHQFVKAARTLARDRRTSFSLTLEGNLREEFRLELPEGWRTDNLDFVVADVLRLPFARESFRQTASLNLLDRVSYPLAHLFEMNRVAAATKAQFLFADPFSWSTNAAPEERWLGGTSDGRYRGRGIDNVRAILEGAGGTIAPPWQIDRAGAVTWRLRSHVNHLELIKSQYLVATR